jgi:transcriptional regulator with XRE-family HTH domain
VGRKARQDALVALSLQKQLGRFLRKQRGELSYPEFAKKTGISSSSLQRMELGEQNVTLKTIEQILTRLKCRLQDVFPPNEG